MKDSFGLDKSFDSIDMSGEMFAMRMVATLADEKISDLKRGLVKNYNKFTNALKLVEEYLIIHDEKNIDWNKIRAKAKREFRKNPKIEVWAIDHIGKIKYKEPQFRRFEIAEVTSGAKAIGEEFGVVPILLTQLNRESISRAGNKPNLADLKESSSIEEDATHVILPHREAYHNKGKNEREPDITDAELIVAKNQTGPTGIARCKFNSKFTKFANEGFEIVYEGGDEIYHNDSQSKQHDMPIVLG